MLKRLADCQRVIGYWFANPQLLEIALTHSSVRTPDRECNERQEFLGDSVLGLAITDELYRRLPDQQEGELTRIKSAVVSRGALYRVSTRLGLPRFIEIAKGVGRRDEIPVSLTANLVESIIGAIYLDAGFFPAREFILVHLGPELEDTLNDRVPRNYKSLLQHEGQHLLGATPIYRTIEEEGPDHRKSFTVACILKGTEYGRATGINKKEAEQEAARHALEALTTRGRGGRRRRGREGGRDGGRDGDRESARGAPRNPSLPPLSPEEEAWRLWAERQAAGGHAGEAQPSGGPDSRPAVGPEYEEADEDDRSSAESPRPGFGAGIAPAHGVDRSIRSEADGEPFAAPAPVEGAVPAGDRAPSDGPGDDQGPDDGAPRGRRRRRGGRGRGRRGDTDAPPDADRPLDVAAPEFDSDAAPDRAPEPVALPPASPPSDETQSAPPPEAPDGAAGRGRRGGRGRSERAPATVPTASEDVAPPARAPRSRTPRAADPAPAPARAASKFGVGVVSEGVPPPPKPIEKAVTQVGGVSAVKKAPKTDPPPTSGGFGTGL